MILGAEGRYRNAVQGFHGALRMLGQIAGIYAGSWNGRRLEGVAVRETWTRAKLNGLGGGSRKNPMGKVNIGGWQDVGRNAGISGRGNSRDSCRRARSPAWHPDGCEKEVLGAQVVSGLAGMAPSPFPSWVPGELGTAGTPGESSAPRTFRRCDVAEGGLRQTASAAGSAPVGRVRRTRWQGSCVLCCAVLCCAGHQAARSRNKNRVIDLQAATADGWCGDAGERSWTDGRMDDTAGVLLDARIFFRKDLDYSED